MADADEDVIPRSRPGQSSATTSSLDPSVDLEDEAQDFRFLTSITNASLRSKAAGSAVPKRGEKDFEPNPTLAQSNTLHASRQAMHDALSVERIHPPRGSIVGQYLPYEKDWRWDTVTDMVGRGGRCVVVDKFKTSHAKSVGAADYRNWTWLLPEEALFLLERGTIDIRWPDEGTKAFEKEPSINEEQNDQVKGTSSARDLTCADGSRQGQEEQIAEHDETRYNTFETASDDGEGEGDGDDEDSAAGNRHRMQLHVGELPMSLQGAYASFIGKSGLDLERYSVYSGLKRLGYIVLRAPTWENSDEAVMEITNGHAVSPQTSQTSLVIHTPSPQAQPNRSPLSLINRLFTYLINPGPRHYCSSLGPLVSPGIYRNYNDLFRALSLIPYQNKLSNPIDLSTPSASPPPSSSEPGIGPGPKIETDPTTKNNPTKSPFNISYHVYKPTPNTKFRKSNPPPPDFRVVVLDARTTSVPTLSQLSHLFDIVPEDALPKDKKIEQKLKHGVRNVILAVVDCGIVSYLRVADMMSGTEGRVFESKVRGGDKGRGRGGARGRGSGRGRGARR